jgi:hypothetical protein
MSDFNNLTIENIKDKEYWISKLGSDFIDSNIILNWDDVLTILNATELCYFEDTDTNTNYLEIYNKNENKYKYNRYNFYNPFNNCNEIYDFCDIINKFLFNLLPHTVLESFEYGSTECGSELNFEYFKGIPKTLKKLTLPSFLGVNFNKYKDQLKKIELIDLDVRCGECDAYLQKKPLNCCDMSNVECFYSYCKHQNFNNFYVNKYKSHYCGQSNLKCLIYQRASPINNPYSCTEGCKNRQYYTKKLYIENNYLHETV